MTSRSGWESVPLHRVAEVRTGLSKNSGREGPTVRRPYLRVANVQDGFLDLSEIKEIDVPENEVRRFTLQPGDLLLVEGNGNPENLGRGCVWNGAIADCVHQNHIFAVRILPGAEMLPRFLALQLQSDHGRAYLLSCAKGTTGLATLNSTQLRYVPVVAPSFAEQKSIVSAIETWNTALQKTEQLIAAKERHYCGVVRRLINNREIASRRVARIRDIAARIQREGDGTEHPLLTISSASGFVRQDDKYRRYMAGESAKTYTLLRAGEFSYNRGNSKRYEFGCVFQLQSYQAALVPSVYVSFRVDESAASSAYMRHLFLADYLKPQLRALVKTGVRNNGLLNIRPDEFMCTTVPLPSLHVQAQIATFLDAVRTEIDVLRQQLSALLNQKRGLMQKLLTGQWRLRLPDQEAV